MPAYTHPSCWTAEDSSLNRVNENTAMKRTAHARVGDNAGLAEIVDHNVANAMEQVGAVNEDELEAKMEDKKLR